MSRINKIIWYIPEYEGICICPRNEGLGRGWTHECRSYQHLRHYICRTMDFHLWWLALRVPNLTYSTLRLLVLYTSLHTLLYFTAYFAPPVPNDTTSNLLFSIEWWPNSEFCINNSFIISLMASNVCGFSLKQIIFFFFFWERVFNLLHHFIIRSKH